MVTKHTIIALFFKALLVMSVTRTEIAPAKVTIVRPKVVVWDLGGVLFRSSRLSLAIEIGLGCLIHYTITHLPSPAFNELLFNILNHIEPMPEDTIRLHDEKGRELPYYMYKWITGQEKGPQINQEIQEFIDSDKQPGFFSGATQKKVCSRLSDTLFMPKTFAHGVKPIKAGRDLLRACRERGTARMMILSNWDSLSFELLRTSPAGSVILRHFDAHDCMISGSIGYAKPDPRCFKHFLNTYALAAHDCVFIDDQLENVEAAKKCGMHGIHLAKGDYHAVAATLRSFDIL